MKTPAIIAAITTALTLTIPARDSDRITIGGVATKVSKIPLA